MIYKEEQVGWFSNLALLLIPAIILILFILEDNLRTDGLILILIVISVFVVSFLLFYKLKVIVNDKFVIISFGIGLIRKKILIADLATVRKSRSKWYNGWGIKYLGNGWLYNIQGLNVIELSFINKNNIIRIGTKANSHLEREIKKRIVN